MDFISILENQKVVKKPIKRFKKNKISSRNKLSNCHTKGRIAQKKRRFNPKDGGIIYLGHIPHGFYEDEMRSYFNQFGKVIGTAIVRSEKTGRSKGYGFVQFQDEDVAKIAAETMNNYLMFNRVIKCRYIPPEERNGSIVVRLISANNYPRQKNRRIQLMNKQKALSNLTQSAYLLKAQKKINEFNNFFKKNDIDFTFKLKSEKFPDNDKNEAETSLSDDVKSESKSETETNDCNCDESDNEIFLKAPPQVKKIKRSLNFPTASEKDFITSKNSVIGKTAKDNLNSKKIKNQKTEENLEKIKKKNKLLKNL